VSPLLALVALVALVVLATGLGLLHRARAGRVVQGSGAVLSPAAIGTTEAFGERATLVQFSTPTCARCPGTARLLTGIAAQHAGVVHIEVDLTRHPEVADRFGVLQTPTTLLVDAARRVHARIGGAPRPDALDRELQTVLGGTRAR
jgi:thiol-disulfide isomerase/thioredoxin